MSSLGARIVFTKQRGPNYVSVFIVQLATPQFIVVYTCSDAHISMITLLNVCTRDYTDDVIGLYSIALNYVEASMGHNTK